MPGRPKLDGEIDDAYWKQALRLDEFRVLGTPAIKAAVKTRVLCCLR
ncbi:MAG: hypothetical protein L3J71_04885 [Victivallaceae bacterium]|nr:hypothetical protein [Victivallaceae bacterium]